MKRKKIHFFAFCILPCFLLLHFVFTLFSFCFRLSLFFKTCQDFSWYFQHCRIHLKPINDICGNVFLWLDFWDTSSLKKESQLYGSWTQIIIFMWLGWVRSRHSITGTAVLLIALLMLYLSMQLCLNVIIASIYLDFICSCAVLQLISRCYVYHRSRN